MSNDWNLSLRPVLKKAGPSICANYRRISFLPIAYKVLTDGLFERMKPLVETQIGPISVVSGLASHTTPNPGKVGEESISNDWNLSILHSVLKKAGPSICPNYRRISFLLIAYKVLTDGLFERMKPLLETQIGPISVVSGLASHTTPNPGKVDTRSCLCCNI